MGNPSHSSSKKSHRSQHESGSNSRHASSSASGSSSHRHTSQSSSCAPTSVQVVVQPPTQTSVSTALYPPLVARGLLGYADANSNGYPYATAVLLDTHGNVLVDQVAGTVAQTAVNMADPAASSSRRSGGSSSSSSQSRQALYFTFPDLNVLYPGNYVLQVNMYMVEYSDSSTRLLAQDHSLSFSVYGQAVAMQGAAPAERSILQRLRDNGVAITL